jgi:hypothetical protein
MIVPGHTQPKTSMNAYTFARKRHEKQGAVFFKETAVWGDEGK